MRDTVDFMSPPSPALLGLLNLDAFPYTGSARPSAEWFAAMKSRGLTVHTMTQETISTRSQQGFQAGVYDCLFAESRAREVNPDILSIAVVVSDGSWSDIWDCSAYGRGWASVATLRFFPYGATECCSSFIRGARSINNLVIDGEWIPETWGAGRLLTQVVGSSPIPDTDLNHVHADYTGGPAPVPQAPEDEDDMHIALLKALDGTYGAMLVNGGFMDEDFGQANAGDFQKIPAAAWAWFNADPVNKDIRFRAYSVAGWNKVRGRGVGSTVGTANGPLTVTLSGTAKPA